MSSNERFKNGTLSGIITKSGKSSLPVSTFRSEDLDSMLKNGVSLKDSPTTTAALVRFPESDTEYFLKRNNNKGFRFTCRYLFRKARVFHAAEMAEVFENLKIRTPKAYMAAEKKTGLYLHAGYIRIDLHHAGGFFCDAARCDVFIDLDAVLSVVFHNHAGTERGCFKQGTEQLFGFGRKRHADKHSRKIGVNENAAVAVPPVKGENSGFAGSQGIGFLR